MVHHAFRRRISLILLIVLAPALAWAHTQALFNTLGDFHVQPRLSVPFTGPSTLLGEDGRRIGIDQ